MLDNHFKKEEFKKSVKENVKMLYRKTIEEATQEQIFQAVSLAVKDVIIDNWLLTQKQYEKDDPKIVYYLSMEFLMGRALGNNLINMTVYKDVKEALDEMGIEYNIFSDTMADIFAKVNISKLTLALAEQECDVISLTEREESLESFYVNLIGGGNRNE